MEKLTEEEIVTEELRRDETISEETVTEELRRDEAISEETVTEEPVEELSETRMLLNSMKKENRPQYTAMERPEDLAKDKRVFIFLAVSFVALTVALITVGILILAYLSNSDSTRPFRNVANEVRLEIEQSV